MENVKDSKDKVIRVIQDGYHQPTWRNLQGLLW